MLDAPSHPVILFVSDAKIMPFEIQQTILAVKYATDPTNFDMYQTD